MGNGVQVAGTFVGAARGGIAQRIDGGLRSLDLVGRSAVVKKLVDVGIRGVRIEPIPSSLGESHRAVLVSNYPAVYQTLRSLIKVGCRFPGQGHRLRGIGRPEGGPEACLHLMSLISMVDHDLAVVYSPLLPVPFWQYLSERDVSLVHVPDEEWETMGPNVLALAPRKCVMLEGNPISKRQLEEAGCEVFTYEGNEVSLKAEGGPTCLTRPILRSP